ncbi:DRC1 protein, partial [Hypocryptadius cinnamomeus]|nr:DRC1 protein [Hypocryptadius cinnamomeus]
QSLESELERVTGQFQETRNRMRQLMRSSAEKFRQVWIVNEEEAKALIREVLDADRIIHVQQLGMPWEEPHLWFMDNVGPLGRPQEKGDAMQLATKLLEGGIRKFLGNLPPVWDCSPWLCPLFPGVFPKEFLLENKLLKPLR